MGPAGPGPAAFHWIDDHDLLFANLAAVMRPGARLTSDCGGQGQLAILGAALEEVTGAGKYGVSYRGLAETRASLEGAGFVVDLPLDEQREFVRRVRSAMAEPVIDYVRLEIDAIRS